MGQALASNPALGKRRLQELGRRSGLLGKENGNQKPARGLSSMLTTYWKQRVQLEAHEDTPGLNVLQWTTGLQTLGMGLPCFCQFYSVAEKKLWKYHQACELRRNRAGDHSSPWNRRGLQCSQPLSARGRPILFSTEMSSLGRICIRSRGNSLDYMWSNPFALTLAPTSRRWKSRGTSTWN